MAERKPFLLRLDRATHNALERWAADELRSLNAQIEYLLRRSLQEAGRLPRPGSHSHSDAAAENAKEHSR
jgi:hypothetical protein